jgi:hypothetical protein
MYRGDQSIENNEQDWDSGMMPGKMKPSLLRNDAGKNELI